MKMEEARKTSGETGQVQSADDILNELFTELGSKKPTDSIVDFLNTPKKKKKHKEKEKKKEKGKRKKKEKTKKQKEVKISKKHFDEVESNDIESPTPAKKKKADKKSHSYKKSIYKVRDDLEDGEIKDKPRGSKKRRHSVEEDYEPEVDYYQQRAPRYDDLNIFSKSSRKRSPDIREEIIEKSRSPPRRCSYDGTERVVRKLEYRNSERYPPPRRPEFDRNHSADRNYEKSYDRGYNKNYDRRYDRNCEKRDTDYRNYDRRSPGRNFDDRRFESRPGSSNNRKPCTSEYESNPEYHRRRGYNRHSRSRSRSRQTTDVIDKSKLLEIARRNATLLMKKGVLPTDIFSKDQIMAIKAGGKSVEELTSYCRRLARKDARGEDDEPSGNESGGEAEHFIHHPFIVKERPMPQITLNIRNAIPLPVRTPQELAIENAVRKSQFPVSSGCQHRFKELEWKEVGPEDEKNKDKIKTKPEAATEDSKPVGTVVPLVHQSSTETPALVTMEMDEIPNDKDTGVSLEPPELPQVDIGSVISARLKAMRTLKDNPESEEAKKELENSLVEMDQWAQAKALEPKFLSVSELQTGPQAWAKRDQLKNAKEVASGMGMHLLQKMGWRPGEGLGKNKEGSTEPLALDVKTDKKGLSSQADLRIKGPQANISMLVDLSGKHPVSALMELCTKRRWGPPVFELCFEHGPAHQKSFVFKVIVNGVEYQPCIATNNKKLAKANAAAFCLQSLGLLKSNSAPSPTETLQTVQPPTMEVAGIKMVSSHLLQTVPNNP